VSDELGNLWRLFPSHRPIAIVRSFAALSARAFIGSTNMSIADTSTETPAATKPPYVLPVLWLMKPKAYGPTNPPRIPTDVIRAMPEAAENPVRNSLANDQKGPWKLQMPIATNDHSKNESQPKSQKQFPR
jgi:hypothetical protein